MRARRIADGHQPVQQALERRESAGGLWIDGRGLAGLPWLGARRVGIAFAPPCEVIGCAVGGRARGLREGCHEFGDADGSTAGSKLMSRHGPYGSAEPVPRSRAEGGDGTAARGQAWLGSAV